MTTRTKTPTDIIKPVALACLPQTDFYREYSKADWNAGLAVKNLLLKRMNKDGFGLRSFPEFPFIGMAIEHYLSLVDWRSIGNELLTLYKIGQLTPSPSERTEFDREEFIKKATAKIKQHINHDCSCFQYEDKTWDEEFLTKVRSIFEEKCDRNPQRLAEEYMRAESIEEGYSTFPDYPFIEKAVETFWKYPDWSSLGNWFAKKLKLTS